VFFSFTPRCFEATGTCRVPNSASVQVDDSLDRIPLPPSAHAAPVAAPEPVVSTWITKEGGNRRMPFDRARLLGSIRAIHAEFPHCR